MKVLVVEDAEGMRKIVAAMLRNLGFDDVDTAENGAVGLEFLTATKIDLLVTNWNMPVMNGLELVKQLRQMPQYVSLPYFSSLRSLGGRTSSSPCRPALTATW